MFDGIGSHPHRFEDFRANGLLLPCDEPAALRMGLPLHRGPHRLYSQMVTERVSQIESAWGRLAPRDAQAAAVHAHMRLDLLQHALRRYLLDGRRRRLTLNRNDPLGAGVDFTELDAMVDHLWDVTRSASPAGTVHAMPVRARSSAMAD